MARLLIPSLIFASRCCSILVAACFLALSACDHSQTVTKDNAGPEVSYGTRISFGQGGNSEPYRTSGWSKTEENFTWTQGTSAKLRIPVRPTSENITLTMTLAGLIKLPELPVQPVEVYVNDQKVADWQVGEAAPFTAAIPPEATKGGVLAITFKIPKAISPKTLGTSADPRVLGICCLDLELDNS